MKLPKVFIYIALFLMALCVSVAVFKFVLPGEMEISEIPVSENQEIEILVEVSESNEVRFKKTIYGASNLDEICLSRENVMDFIIENETRNDLVCSCDPDLVFLSTPILLNYTKPLEVLESGIKCSTFLAKLGLARKVEFDFTFRFGGSHDMRNKVSFSVPFESKGKVTVIAPGKIVEYSELSIFGDFGFSVIGNNMYVAEYELTNSERNNIMFHVAWE